MTFPGFLQECDVTMLMFDIHGKSCTILPGPRTKTHLFSLHFFQNIRPVKHRDIWKYVKHKQEAKSQ